MANNVQFVHSHLAEQRAVLRQFDQARSEVEVVQKEIGKYHMNLSIDMLQRETAALSRAFEMSNHEMQVYIHPVQQFAATLDQAVDARNHLDLLNKVPAIQKLLTQLANRSALVETLTSGAGILISQADLNACLEECCRSLIKSSEIEMRTRCESLTLVAETLLEKLYCKDRQLMNIENKLSYSKQQLTHIVNAKVFL